MFRNIFCCFGLLSVSLVVEAKVREDVKDQNELNKLWSSFKFPESAEKYLPFTFNLFHLFNYYLSRVFVDKDASQEGRSFESATNDVR